MTYIDPSSYISVFLNEARTSAVIEELKPIKDLATSDFSEAEMIASFNKLLRMGKLSESDVMKLHQILIANFKTSIKILSLIPKVTSLAKDLLLKYYHHNLRAPDTLHIATAVHYGCEKFISSDKKQADIVKLTKLELIYIS